MTSFLRLAVLLVLSTQHQSVAFTVERSLQRPFAVAPTARAVQSASHAASRLARLRLWAAYESIDEIALDCEDRMEKSVDSVRQNLATIRTGRASVNMLDRVKADYYGVETPINQMATISVPSAQQLSISPFDKSQLSAIERAIMESGLGLSPNNDGSVIRINIPALTEDRRKDMLKQCKAIGEEGKVAIRNIRRDGVDAIKKMEKSSGIGEDEMKDGLDEMQKMTDKKIKEIDDVVTAKEKEVMKV